MTRSKAGPGTVHRGMADATTEEGADQDWQRHGRDDEGVVPEEAGGRGRHRRDSTSPVRNSRAKPTTSTVQPQASRVVLVRYLSNNTWHGATGRTPGFASAAGAHPPRETRCAPRLRDRHRDRRHVRRDVALRGRFALPRTPSARRGRLDQGPLEDDRQRARARVYDITADGRKQLTSEEARWRAITAAVGHILKHA